MKVEKIKSESFYILGYLLELIIKKLVIFKTIFFKSDKFGSFFPWKIVCKDWNYIFQVKIQQKICQKTNTESNPCLIVLQNQWMSPRTYLQPLILHRFFHKIHWCFHAKTFWKPGIGGYKQNQTTLPLHPLPPPKHYFQVSWQATRYPTLIHLPTHLRSQNFIMKVYIAIHII